jgi:hypothetical protein
MPASSTYTPIATFTTVNTSVTDYSFNSIPLIYTDLILVAFIRGAASQAQQQLGLYLGDGSSLFQSNQNSNTNLFGDGSSALSSRTSNSSGNFVPGGIPGGTSTSGVFGTYIFHIMNYSNTTSFKTVISRTAKDLNGSGIVSEQIAVVRTNNAIRNAGLATYGDGAFAVGSTFTLYGIAAA